MSEKLKCFISYSHEDENAKKQLLKHLVNLERQDLVEFWHDRCLFLGDDLDKEIMKNLESADIVIFLLSSDFINSYYCYEKELKFALERKNTRFVSLVVRHCDWKNTPLSKFVMATDANPLNKAADPDEFLLSFNNSLRRLIEDLKKK